MSAPRFREQLQALSRSQAKAFKATPEAIPADSKGLRNAPQGDRSADRPAEACVLDAAPRGANRDEGEGRREPRAEKHTRDEWVDEGCCDPMARSLMQWASPLAPATAVSPPVQSMPSAVLEQIAGQVVKRIRIGDGTVHLQLGSGRLEGGEVLVTSGTDGLDVRVTAPSGVDGSKLGEAIRERLTKRGLRVATVEVE